MCALFFFFFFLERLGARRIMGLWMLDVMRVQDENIC